MKVTYRHSFQETLSYTNIILKSYYFHDNKMIHQRQEGEEHKEIKGMKEEEQRIRR